MEEFSPEFVGLAEDRPFRISTLEYVPSGAYTEEPPGDDRLGERERAMRMTIPVREGAYVSPPHSHAFYEIALIRNGVARHLSEGDERWLRRGMVVLVPPGSWHAYKQISAVVYTNLYIQPTWLLDDLQLLWAEAGLIRLLLAGALYRRPDAPRPVFIGCQETETGAWERELDEIEAEARMPRPSLALFNGGFLKILHVLNRAYERQPENWLPAVHPVVWEATAAIERLIADGRPLDLGRLAGALGTSPAYLARLFRRHAGWSPQGYYQRRRVQRATSMLRDPSRTVTEVAHHLGYVDASHLYRMCKRYAADAPSAFRRGTGEAPAALP